MKTLYLTLKKEWFDMIASGEKLEEYREIKEFWASRLLYKIPVPWGGYLSAWNDIQKGDLECKGWKKFLGGNNSPVFQKFDAVEFRNGYSPTSPNVLVECKGIDIGKGNPEWGAPSDKEVFIIKLGKIIS